MRAIHKIFSYRVIALLLLAYSLAWLLAGCISSKFDREHHCKMTCKGECNSSCEIIMEQGSTEITLPGQ